MLKPPALRRLKKRLDKGDVPQSEVNKMPPAFQRYVVDRRADKYKRRGK